MVGHDDVVEDVEGNQDQFRDNHDEYKIVAKGILFDEINKCASALEDLFLFFMRNFHDLAV